MWLTSELDSWLPQALGPGLFFFSKPGRDRLISNWFIAAEPQNSLLRLLYERLCEYWRKGRFNFSDNQRPSWVGLLERGLRRNAYLPRLWLRWPLRYSPASPPYMIYHYMFAELVATDTQCAKIWEDMVKIPADLPHRLLRHGLLNPADHEFWGIVQDARPPVFKLNWKVATTGVPEGSVLGEILRLQSLGARVDGQKQSASL